MTAERNFARPIYLARHGETEFNVERRWQGAANDSSLTELGRQQAKETGLILRGLIDPGDPPYFVSSPLGRARATMELVLSELGLLRDAYSTDARLVEIDLGEWTGALADDVKVNDRERWEARKLDRWNVPCPGGESYAMAARRASDWLASLKRETVVVSHGVFGRILRACYADFAPERISELETSPHGSVFRLHEGSIFRLDYTAAPPNSAPAAV
jgi:probable phosphoglycerate mutase